MSAKRTIRDLERELKREPNNLALRLTLAAAYREANRGGDALELYRSVARAYLEQGRAMQAAAVCRSALEIAPTDGELYGMLHHLDRTSPTQPPPFAAGPVGSAPAMPAWAMPADQPHAAPAPPPPAPGYVAAPAPGYAAAPAPGYVAQPPSAPHLYAPPHAPTMMAAAPAYSEPADVPPAPDAPVPRAARVLEADAVALREVGTVAPTVKHVPPPPPRPQTPTSRNSTLDSDTPLPDPLPLHETTGRDSLVEMAEILTGPSRPSSPSSPSIPVPASLAPSSSRPSTGAPVATPPPRARSRPVSHDDDSETIVPLTQVRGPTGPVRVPGARAPASSPVPSDVVRGAIGARPGTSPPLDRAPLRRPLPTRPPPPPRPPGGATRPPGAPTRPPGAPVMPRPPSAPVLLRPPSAPSMPRPHTTPVVPPATSLPRLTRPRVAPPPAPIDDAPTDHGPRATTADYAADMVTRKRPKLSAHDLALLDLGPTAAEPADDAVTNPGPASDQRAGSESGTATERHPAALVDDDDTGDTGDTGVAVFDEEPTHPPVGDDGTLRGDARPGPGQRAATEDAATELGATFERSFDATLSSLGPDGSVLEGPLGVFSMLPTEAAHELSRRAVVKQYEPGEIIIREGDPGDACYVIARGVVVVQRRGDGDEPVELARLTDGSMFGEFALLADRRRHATVLALTEVEVFEVPRLLLRELAAVFPEVGPALERFYRERLLANLLRTTPLFNLVPEDQRPSLLARFHPLHGDSGQAIVRQGERAGGLYLIVLGAVEVVRRVGERRAVVLATLGEGAYFGEMSLLSGEMASASVVAAGPCELAVLPPRDFYDLVAHNPGLWTSMRTVAESRRLANAQILAGHTSVV